MHDPGTQAAILFGLLSAVGFGATDFCAGAAARAAGFWRSLFYSDLLTLIALSVWLALSRSGVAAVHVAPAITWTAAVTAGAVILVGGVCLTRGLMIGNLAVVAPITSSYAAIAAVLSLLSGEKLSARIGGGILLTVIGVALVSIPARAASSDATAPSGARWAAAAAISYGVGFWVQARFAVPLLGPVLPVWVAYLVALVVVAALYRRWQTRLGPPGRRAVVPVLATGLFSSVGYLGLSAGAATGHVAVVAVLSSLASAITVLLGRLISRIAVASHQWLAIGLIACALLIING